MPHPPPDTAFVEFREVDKSYDGRTLTVQDFNLEVARGEFVTLLGPSGSGKSTCLKMLAGFEHPDRGEIWLHGRPVAAVKPHKRNIGLVFQHYALFPHMTIAENLAFPLRTRRLPTHEVEAGVARALDMIQLQGFESRHPGQLSGGQQQRVAIARALAMKPDVMLFDEVTSSLDPELVGEVLNTMRDLSAEGMTMIVVTHELGFAYHLARQVLFLHDGVIHEQGTPDEVLKHPQQERTKGFLAGFTDFYF